MERSRRMKKRKCMCMIFIFSSLCSCSCRTVPWQAVQRARLHLRVAQRSRAASNPKREANLLHDWELRSIGSSRTIIEFRHNFILDIASAGSVYFSGPSKYAKSRGWFRETVAEKLRGAAAKVFHEWPEDFTENLEIADILAALMTRIRNVLF